MYKEEAPISPAGSEHSKTSGRNYKLKVNSEAFQQRAVSSGGRPFLLFLKDLKHNTERPIPNKTKRQRRNEDRERERLIL